VTSARSYLDGVRPGPLLALLVGQPLPLQPLVGRLDLLGQPLVGRHALLSELRVAGGELLGQALCGQLALLGNHRVAVLALFPDLGAGTPIGPDGDGDGRDGDGHGADRCLDVGPARPGGGHSRKLMGGMQPQERH